MNAIDHFSTLKRADVWYILREAGDFSNVSKVCKLFKQIADKEAKTTYAELATLFGAPSLARAIKKMGLSNASCSVKVDRFFFDAITLSRPGDGKACMSYNRDYLEALKVYMRPWVEADAVFKLWDFLSKNGDLGLKELLKKIRLSPENDYLENIRLICAFFKANKGELSDSAPLNLSCSELRALSPSVCLYFTHLKTLDLTKNVLWELPKEIGNLSELTVLRLSHNYLKSLPEEIGNLRDLENFQCSFNLFEEVPSTICNLEKLKMLNLSCNRLHRLPEMGNFKALNYLYLEGNRLNSLPSSIGTIPYLIGLYLCGNEIAMLPDSFCELSELKHLSAQCNALTSLPYHFGKMTSLRSLHIDNNKIKELPQSITSLLHLNQLFLSNNQLSDFPEGMGRLKLKLFCFENNPIEVFPHSMQFLPFWSRNPQFYPYLKDGRLQKVLNKSMTKHVFDSIYWGLGRNKWKECIDGVHHPFKQDVYDKGLHGKKIEPGFLNSMMKTFKCLASDGNVNRPVDASFYLAMHESACRHFKGDATSTLMGQEKVGLFRDRDDVILANFKEPDYAISEDAINEFHALNVKISLLFGSSFRLGDMALKSKSSNPRRSIDIYYFPLSRDQVRLLFDFFLTEFYYDIGHAENKYLQIQAIAKLIQRLEWLHPTRDGCGRTDTALLNFLLTCYGFNPVLLKFPYVSSCISLDEWTQAIIDGMKDWRVEAGREIA